MAFESQNWYLKNIASVCPIKSCVFLDPNDPRNADLMASLSSVRGKSTLFTQFTEPMIKNEGYFR